MFAHSGQGTPEPPRRLICCRRPASARADSQARAYGLTSHAQAHRYPHLVCRDGGTLEDHC